MLIKNKLLIGSVVLAVVPVALVSVIIGWQSYIAGKDTLEWESQQKLIALRENKASQIESYFDFIRKQIVTMAEDRMIVDATQEFSSAYDNLLDEVSVDIESERSKLASYYLNQFPTEYEKRNVDQPSTIRNNLNLINSRAVILQQAYINNNPHPLGSKDKLLTSQLNTNYDQVHQKYHEAIRHYLHEFGYYDIFLVELKTGNVVYSVFKELDYATSLLNGPYKDSGLAKAFRAGARMNTKYETALIDFAPYFPSYEDPASFIATPIFDGKQKVGVLIFQMPVDRINDIMTNSQQWQNAGYGESGETYLVGADGYMRSQSRFLLEDKAQYLEALQANSIDTTTVDKINMKNTSIGLQAVNSPGVKAALAGEAGFDIFKDYRGVPVLSAYKPLKINGLNWALMSEIDEAEAFKSTNDLATKIFLIATIMLGIAVVISVIIGLMTSRHISKPITAVVNSLRDISQGEGDLTVRLDEGRSDEIGQLAYAFNQFVAKVQNLVVDINQSVINVSSSAEELSAITQETQQNFEMQKQDTEQVATSMN